MYCDNLSMVVTIVELPYFSPRCEMARSVRVHVPWLEDVALGLLGSPKVNIPPHKSTN